MGTISQYANRASCCVGVYGILRLILSLVLPSDKSYANFVDSWGSPMWCFFFVSWGVNIGIYFGANIFLVLVHASRLFTKYEIQTDKLNEAALHWNCGAIVSFNLLVLSPIVLISGWPMYAKLGLDITGPVPTPDEVLCNILVFIFIEDTLFYWVHRALHSKRFYQPIHKLHHQYRIPNGWATAFAHPVEYLVANISPNYAGPLVVGLLYGRCHVITTWVWAVIVFSEAIDAHSGYELPFSPFGAFWPVRPSAEEHDWHHSKNAGNFGSWTTFWDDYMGTSRTQVTARLARGRAKGMEKKTD
eukprot:m.28962 g.28962  ORF g.28962 m.28962 type:complete len:302 (-) comp13662_c0_seq6:3371-4276(-)